MLVLYGAGKRCGVLCEYIDNIRNLEFIIADSNKEKWGNTLGGYKINSPKVLNKIKNIRLCITVENDKDRADIRDNIECYCQDCYHIDEISYDALVIELAKKSLLVHKSCLPLETNNKLNVIFDCYASGVGLGGVESWTLSICKELLKHDRIMPYIISKFGQYDVSDEIKNHIIYVDVDLKKRFSKKNIDDLIEILVSKLPCKVVTSHVNELMLAAYLVKCTYPDKIEIVSVVHGDHESAYQQYTKYRECTDKYVAVSKKIKRILMERGITNKQIPAMTCPFYCEKNLIRTYTEDTSKPLRLGYAGRFDGMEHSQKRMDLMLKLIGELVARKIDFVFELAGDGPAKKNMEEFIANNGYKQYVKLIGQIANSDIPLFWRKQDILVNCSDFEGHSIMQMEAMANGAVPVVTDVSGVRDDIINNVNGFYVPVGDYMQIADKIEYLFNHRELLSDMGRKAHDEMYPKSSMDEHIKFWERILLDTQ